MQELICKIANAASLRELEDVVANLPQKNCLQHVSYHYLGGPNHPPPALPGFTTYPIEWVQIYLDNNYQNVDPVVQRATRSILPFEWSELTIDTPEQQKLFADSQAFDLGAAALSIPICGHEGELALFTITSQKSDAFHGPDRSAVIRDYRLLGVYVHESFARLHALSSVQKPEISEPEINCLRLAACSLLGKEIAHQLKLSEPAVRLYLRVVRHKLGVATTTDAVKVAKQRGLF